MILGDWLDYLRDCQKLGYDMKEDRILRPKDLGTAHEETAVLAKEKEQEITREGIQKRAKEAQKYAWEQDGFLIRPIATLKELVAEGTKLKHCVAGYASSYAEGRCKLFCIRKKSAPDTPYYTLELGRNDKLIQCRGYRNDVENGYKMQEDVRKFVDRWMSKVVNKKKKERIKVNAA
ncbi:MAG: PcfJ domain-containing protein [Clostridium sp.]|nr:PcfJ domain-containing protein [Clostridium sp.]